MSYQPQFNITPALLARVEQIAVLRERILAATVEVPWIASPAANACPGIIIFARPKRDADHQPVSRQPNGTT